MATTMKDAICAIHNLNNVHTITEESGITAQALEQWKQRCEELRTAVRTFAELTLQESPKAKETEAARGAVYAAWRPLCKDVFGKDWDKNGMMSRGLEAWALACAKRNINTPNGSQLGIKSPGEFRREVERHLGIRIAQNEVLTDNDVDTLTKYQDAQKSLKSNNERLNGRSKGDTVVPGLTQQLEEAVKAYTKAAEDYEQAQEAYAPLLAHSDPMVVGVAKAQLFVLKTRVGEADTTKTSVKKSLDAAETAVKNAQKTIDELQETVEGIYARLKTV